MSNEMSVFSGVRAVVTGGGSGIGRALCEQLAAAGARVVVADLLVETAHDVAEAIGGGAVARACDVSERNQVMALAEFAKAELGGVDMVFANAGVAIAGKLADTEPQEFQWVFDVNVGGVFHTAQAFIPMLREAAAAGRPARLVITGSENALGLPLTGPSSAYTATKHAVLGMADALRRDLAPDGVAVSVFCPGVVATRVWDARRARPERFGGASPMPADFAERAEKAMQAHGMAPADTVAQVLAGIERDEFMIITDPRIRQLAEKRACEVAEALQRCDAAMAKGV
jgi:NAD(P)-dependent dehydrogenase (short-subunit alcohol dehydrogenase family)